MWEESHLQDNDMANGQCIDTVTFVPLSLPGAFASFLQFARFQLFIDEPGPVKKPYVVVQRLPTPGYWIASIFTNGNSGADIVERLNQNNVTITRELAGRITRAVAPESLHTQGVQD